MQQAKVKDADYWARLHVVSDRSKPVDLPDNRRTGCVFSMWPTRKKPTA